MMLHIYHNIIYPDYPDPFHLDFHSSTFNLSCWSWLVIVDSRGEMDAENVLSIWDDAPDSFLSSLTERRRRHVGASFSKLG